MIGAVLFPLLAMFLLAAFYLLAGDGPGKHTPRYLRTHEPRPDPPRHIDVTGRRF